MPISKTCAVSGKPFSISDHEKEYCENRAIPLPELSPRERFREMLAFRNETSLFERRSTQTGQSIISCYRSGTPFPVIERELWFSEKYVPTNFGQSYDFNRPFFQQYRELVDRVPHPTTLVRNAEKSPYVHLCLDVYNCFYCFSAVQDRDCLYGWRVYNCRDCVDNSFLFDSELCYECVDCRNCYNVQNARHAFQCRDSSFLFNCIACSDCIGCVGLEHKQYCILNEQFTKEEYQTRRAQLRLSSYQEREEFKKRFEDLVKRQNSPYNPNRNIENSTGMYLENCQNCTESYFLKECQDVEYGLGMQGNKDCISVHTASQGSQLIYRSIAPGRNSYDCQFIYQCDQIVHCQYSGILFGCENMFGCFGFPQKAAYCILNKQYTKTEYENLLPRIIDHMRSTGEYGTFFPMAHSDFPYIDTVAQEYFPLSEAEIETRQIISPTRQIPYHWSDPKDIPIATKMYEIPDEINVVPDTICQEILQDVQTQRAYNIQKKELAFYRKLNIPVPRLSFQSRHLIRSKMLFQF